MAITTEEAKEMKGLLQKAVKSGRCLLSINWLEGSEVKHNNFMSSEFSLDSLKPSVKAFGDFCQKQIANVFTVYEGEDKPSTLPQVGYESIKTEEATKK